MERGRGLRNVAGVLLLAGSLGLTGCDECWDGDCYSFEPCDGRAPAIPVGVVSETGDGSVRIRWIPNQEPDLKIYRVYVSSRADGTYHRLGESYGPTFVDRTAVNGTTYYYAVSAIDDCGNESALSREDVFDTPRPEGRGLELARASDRPGLSGYDFSEYRRQSPESRGTDIVFDILNGVPYMLAASPSVGLQDVGFLELDGLDYAPANGWTRSGRVEVTEGHTYAVLTGDGYYAKFRITGWDTRSVIFDWAFQVARGNRELSVETPMTRAGASGEAPGSMEKEPGAVAVDSEGGVKS